MTCRNGKTFKKDRQNYYVIEGVTDINAQNLASVSAYINKAPIQQTENVQAFSSNVQNASVDIETSDGNIAHESDNVTTTARDVVESVQDCNRCVTLILKADKIAFFTSYIIIDNIMILWYNIIKSCTAGRFGRRGKGICIFRSSKAFFMFL